jgi:phosphoglycolate phosphatase
MSYIIDRFKLVSQGSRVAHFAPEHCVGTTLIAKVGEENYNAFDICPELYHRDLKVRRFDLCEAQTLPTEAYDLILHSHILEHISRYLTPVLWHMQRALTEKGTHLFFIPIMDGYSECDLGPSSESERTRRFGQKDHVRRFGKEDTKALFAKIFDLREGENCEIKIPADIAYQHNMARGEVFMGMFMLRKSDLLLT